MSTPLTGKQRSYLRGLAHHLDPVVLVGAAGVTEAVKAKVLQELENHELIKVRVDADGPVGARDLAQPLADATGAHLAQRIGRMIVLYKRRAKDPEIVLPRA